MEMVLTGRRLTAREALACGLVNRVVPVESFLHEAKKLAAEWEVVKHQVERLEAQQASTKASLDRIGSDASLCFAFRAPVRVPDDWAVNSP